MELALIYYNFGFNNLFKLTYIIKLLSKAEG